MQASPTVPIDTSAVDALIARVIQREGGFVDNPADRGGATCWGITIVTLREWRRTPISLADMENLTVEEAEQIYKTKYFTAAGFDRVADPELQEFLFDFAVNSGVEAASEALQSAIGADPDGVLGELSFAALAAVTNYAALFYAVKSKRYELLMGFIGAHHEQSVFATGWKNRIQPFQKKL